jgi:hypothetical protein
MGSGNAMGAVQKTFRLKSVYIRFYTVKHKKMAEKICGL